MMTFAMARLYSCPCLAATLPGGPHTPVAPGRRIAIA
jgi:hypothetical protein